MDVCKRNPGEDITEEASVGSKHKNERGKLRRGGDEEGSGNGGSRRTGG